MQLRVAGIPDNTRIVSTEVSGGGMETDTVVAAAGGDTADTAATCCSHPESLQG